MENPVGPLFEFTPEIREQGLAESRSSPRRRMLLPIHREQADTVQRMVNFLQPGTYIQPHQHPREWASETLLVMSGAMGFLTFSPEGEVKTVNRLGVGDLIDIEAQVWHGVVALAPNTVILEIKRGPFDHTDKVFADWAPTEGAAGMTEYLAGLEKLFTN